MFDRVGSSTASPRWRTALLVITAGGHAVVIAALVVTALWKIERLPVADKTDVRVALMPKLEAPGGPPPGAKLVAVTKPKPPERKRVTVVTQPTPPQAPEPAPVIDPGPAGDGVPGGGGDNPDGDPDSTEVGTGRCAVPPCGIDPPGPTLPPDEPEVKVPPLTMLPPKLAAGLRISGNDRVYPPDRVRVAMLHAGQDTLQGTFKLCVSAGGRMDSVTALKSTGYDDYDAELVREMRAWRYRPYLVGGTPAPMCTVEVVIYRMKK
ncbi:MAG: hypothetical protein R3B06_10480 [Kofleriaceae bacterium]